MVRVRGRRFIKFALRQTADAFYRKHCHWHIHVAPAGPTIAKLLFLCPSDNCLDEHGRWLLDLWDHIPTRRDHDCQDGNWLIGLARRVDRDFNILRSALCNSGILASIARRTLWTAL